MLYIIDYFRSYKIPYVGHADIGDCFDRVYSEGITSRMPSC